MNNFCPRCKLGNMFLDWDELNCINCGFTIGVEKWKRLQARHQKISVQNQCVSSADTTKSASVDVVKK